MQTEFEFRRDPDQLRAAGEYRLAKSAHTFQRLRHPQGVTLSMPKPVVKDEERNQDLSLLIR